MTVISKFLNKLDQYTHSLTAPLYGKGNSNVAVT